LLADLAVHKLDMVLADTPLVAISEAARAQVFS
jgi:hypothetical protein